MIYLQWSWLLETLKDQSDGSLMIYMMVKMVKKNASAIQNNIVTCIIYFVVCFFRLIPFVGLCYFYKLNNQSGEKKKKSFDIL